MALSRQTTAMSPEEFRLLRDLVHQHCGLFFREDMRFLLERRLAPRLAAHGFGDFTAYHRFLRYDAGRRAELEAAADLLTTNETYLFREPQQLRAFATEILPKLAEARAREGRLRIWSAGCSTGEEAYTIALLVKDSGLFHGWDVGILASDIARRVLAAAREGVYGERAFRMAPPEVTARWFRPQGDKRVVSPELRKLVSFCHLNLLDEGMLSVVGPMDVIFCRNVMIYFDLEARRRVVRSFHRKLHDGGYLLIGQSESLLNVTADFELLQLDNDLVYRKPPP
jgi:chemotaxis protein methyltransferase CheR